MATPNWWLIFIVQSTITLRSFLPLTSKTSRSKSVAENFIRPQLCDLIFYTNTFHPFSVTSLEYYSFFHCSTLHSPADFSSKFLFLVSKWNYFQKLNSEEVISLLVQPYLSDSLQRQLTEASLLQPSPYCQDSKWVLLRLSKKVKTKHESTNGLVLYLCTYSQRGYRQSWLGISPSKTSHLCWFPLKQQQILLLSFLNPMAAGQSRGLRFPPRGYSLLAVWSPGNFDFQT